MSARRVALALVVAAVGSLVAVVLWLVDLLDRLDEFERALARERSW